MYGGVRVTFHPLGAVVDVPVGSTVLEAAIAARIPLEAPCGGRGRCGRCAVKVIEGELAPPGPPEAEILAKAGCAPETLRLACRAQVISPVTVRPMLPAGKQISSPQPSASPVVPVSGEVVQVAIDLGTTSLAVRIVHPDTALVLGEGRAVNRQTAWGADILSRVTAALSGEADALSQAAFDSIGDAMAAARESAGLADPSIDRLVVAANPAMVSFLAGVDVTGLATHPFVSAVHTVDEAALSRALGARNVVIVPSVAGFVGGDLVAGLFGAGLDEGADGVLYIDAGTNAEVALVLPDRLLVTSAPAGPAFEGWGISCGGGAGRGGVTRFAFANGNASIEVDDGPPTHLTGSGLLSAVAALVSSGYLSVDGLLTDAASSSGRVFDHEGIRAFSLGVDPADKTLFLTQLDIRAFQFAKGAIASAVKAVIAAAGDARPAKQVIVAGAFGGALAEDDLIALGVVPANLAGHTGLVADSVLEGAAAMALDPGLIESARELVSRAEHVDLAADEGFSSAFVESLELAPYDAYSS